MQLFYLLIGKNKLFLYEKEGNHYNRQYIKGNPDYDYELNSAKNAIDSLKDILKREFNLDTSAEIEFDVIENEDKLCSEIIIKELDDSIRKKYTLEEVIDRTICKLRKDKNLLIDEYGINFDSKNYKLTDNKLIKSKFNLLAYTLKEDKLMTFLE